MNAKIISVLGVASLATCTLVAGPFIVVQPPVVVVNPPPPVVSVTVGVPDDYVWDGTEYVGLVGNQYYYLGPNHVWLTVDAPRLARFNGWARNHGDWRLHAIRNDKYRSDAHGHVVPFRDVRAGPNGHPAPVTDHRHDGDDHR
jgi:hypothetical protein